ncbi:hypothetical protein Gpo141_00014225 [Globisporangium polare]
MATFPLARDAFPVMKFPADQSAAFADCRDRLVHATTQARREFRDKYHMRLDECVWKVLKRTTTRRRTVSSTSSSSASTNSSFTVYVPRRKAQVPKPHSSPSCSPILIGAGSIAGSSLEDVMLGLTSATTSVMRFAAAYMHKDVLDVRVLSTLQAPTEAEPFEYLGFKWMAKGPSFAPMKSFIRSRDFVYLESSGVRVDEHGNAVGHLMMHSVELPGCRSLKKQLGIVRGALSFCFLFSESLETPGSVDVFFKGFVDPRGGVTERIALSAAAESIMACQNAPLCARMKKYSWMVREQMCGPRQQILTSSSSNTSTSSLGSETQQQQQPFTCLGSASETSDEDASLLSPTLRDGCCTVCDVGFSAFTVSLACDICRFDVCSSCVQTVVMAAGGANPTATPTRVAQEHLSFCHHCVNAVEKLDSTRVARDDASHTLRALRQLSGVHYNSSGGVTMPMMSGEKGSERIKLEPLKKRCQSVVPPGGVDECK